MLSHWAGHRYPFESALVRSDLGLSPACDATNCPLPGQWSELLTANRQRLFSRWLLWYGTCTSLSGQTFVHTEHQSTRRFDANERARRYPRHRVRVPVTVITHSDEVHRGLSNDFSEGGMAFYASSRFEVGQFVRVEVRPPGSQDEISLKAVVRDCIGFRCGIEFQELDTRHELLLSISCVRLSALLSTSANSSTPCTS